VLNSVISVLKSNNEPERNEAVRLLKKILENVISDPQNTKFHALQMGNSIQKVLSIRGAPEILSVCGFYQGTNSLVLNFTGDTINTFSRILALLDEKPHTNSTGSEHQNSPSLLQNYPQQNEYGDYICQSCGHVIVGRPVYDQNPIGWRSNTWVTQGEYRFSCIDCSSNLCSTCYDKWKSGDSSTHNIQHRFEIIAPTSGRNFVGKAPPPPPPNSKNRRGPWG